MNPMYQLTKDRASELESFLKDGQKPSWIKEKDEVLVKRVAEGANHVLKKMPMNGEKHRSVFHRELLWQHLLMTALNMAVATGDYVLAVAGFFHDIGKEDTLVIKNVRGYDEKQACYPGHATHGATMLLSRPWLFEAFGIDDEKDKKLIVWLAAQHMCGRYCADHIHCVATVERELRHVYGDEFVQHWRTLHRADNMSRIADDGPSRDWILTGDGSPKFVPITTSHSTRRLVTITGPPGVGKTPLGQELAKHHGGMHVSRDEVSADVLRTTKFWKDDMTCSDVSKAVRQNKLGTYVDSELRKRARDYAGSGPAIIETVKASQRTQIGSVVPRSYAHVQLMVVCHLDAEEMKSAAARKGMSMQTIRHMHYGMSFTTRSAMELMSDDGSVRDMSAVPQIVHVMHPSWSCDSVMKRLMTTHDNLSPPVPMPIPYGPVTGEGRSYTFIQNVIKTYIDRGLPLSAAFDAIRSYRFMVTPLGDDPETTDMYRISYMEPKPLEYLMTVDARNMIVRIGPRGDMQVLVQAMPAMGVLSLGKKWDEMLDLDRHGGHAAAAKSLWENPDKKHSFYAKRDGMHIRFAFFPNPGDFRLETSCGYLRDIHQYARDRYGMGLLLCSNGTHTPTDPGVLRFFREGFEATYMQEPTPQNVVDRLIPFFSGVSNDYVCTHATFSFEAVSNREQSGLVFTHDKCGLSFLGARLFTDFQHSTYYACDEYESQLDEFKIHSAHYWFMSLNEIRQHYIALVRDGVPFPASMAPRNSDPFDDLEGFIAKVSMETGYTYLKVKSDMYLGAHHPGRGHVQNEDVAAWLNMRPEIKNRMTLVRRLEQMMAFDGYKKIYDQYVEWSSNLTDETRPKNAKNKLISNGRGLIFYYAKHMVTDSDVPTPLMKYVADALVSYAAGKPYGTPEYGLKEMATMLV